MCGSVVSRSEDLLFGGRELRGVVGELRMRVVMVGNTCCVPEPVGRLGDEETKHVLI